MTGAGPTGDGFGDIDEWDSRRVPRRRLTWLLTATVLGLLVLTAGPLHTHRDEAAGASPIARPGSPMVATGPTVTSSPRPHRTSPTTERHDDRAPAPGAVGLSGPAASSPGSPAAPAPLTSAPPTSEAAEAEYPTPEIRNPLRLAVVGDSVGLTMQLNLPPRLRDRFRLVDGTIEGCGVFDFGRIRSTSGLGHDMSRCRNFPSRWAGRAAAARAELALVVVGAWETFDLDIHGRAVAFGSPEFDYLFSSGLRRGISALLERGIDVTLLRVPCFGPPPGSILPERGIRGRTTHLNQLLEAAVAENPDRVSIVDPVPELCRDPEMATDPALRWDGVHVAGAGGELIWDRLAGLLPLANTP